MQRRDQLLELMAGQGTTLGYTFAQLARIIELVEDKERVGVEGFRHILNDLRWDGVPMLLETPKKEDGDGKDEQNLRALADLVTDPSRLPEGLRPSP